MRKSIILLTAITIISLQTAEARTWNLNNGGTIEGEYLRSEGENIVIKRQDGTNQTVKATELSEADQLFAKNSKAIFSSKPPALDTTKPEMRVPADGDISKVPDKKTERKTITLSPDMLIEEPDTALTPIEAPPELKATSPVKPVKPASTGESVKTAKKKDQSSLLKNPTELMKRSKVEHLAEALKNAMKKNEAITLYFLVLCLLILIHKMHMPHLYKAKPFRPKKATSQPSDTVKKALQEDDRRERFRECPFCKLTNPTSAEICKHCGQYIK